MPSFADFDYAPEPTQVAEIYSSGFHGTTKEDNLTRAVFRSAAAGFYDSFPQAEGLYKETSVCLPIRACQTVLDENFCADRGESQRQGDCVGKMVRNQGMADGCADHMYGETDWHQDEDGNNVQYCCENHYGDRGHTGEGANCWRVWDNAKLSGRQGFLFRKKYDTPSGTYDLSRYRADLSGPWGRNGTPDALSDIADDNPALQLFRIKSLEEALDAMCFGFGVGRCGSDGWSSKRDENGFSQQSGTWYHAIACGGFDRTQRILNKYGGVGILYYHNWGKWNSGAKSHEQPDGSWWVPARYLERCIKNGEVCALGGIPGENREIIWAKKMDRRSDSKGTLWQPNTSLAS